MRAATAFGLVLERYGQDVVLHHGQGTEVPCRAFLQPVLERSGPQEEPTVLGTVCTDRWLYLGDPAVPLDHMEDGWLQWNGKELEVLRCQPIEVGGQCSHWWAILKEREAVSV